MNNKGQIRRSTTQDSPGTILQPGELAYSYLTNRLYIGAEQVGQPARLISLTNLEFSDKENNVKIIVVIDN